VGPLSAFSGEKNDLTCRGGAGHIRHISRNQKPFSLGKNEVLCHDTGKMLVKIERAGSNIKKKTRHPRASHASDGQLRVFLDSSPRSDRLREVLGGKAQ